MKIRTAPRLHALVTLSSCALLLLIVCAPAAAARQQKPADKPAAQAASVSPPPAGKAAAITAATAPADLARAAYQSLGGDRFRDLKNMVLTGSIDLYAPNSTQSIPGKFGIIAAGDKLRQEMQSPFFNVSVIYDGVRSYSSVRGFEMPPPSKFGLPVLVRHAQPGYAVAALPDKDSKKARAFRVTDPEGNATDFHVDSATGKLTRYEIPFGDVTYIVEIKGTKEIDGVTVPFNFIQKLATPQGSFIAEFKVREAKINQELPADVFNIPAK